MAQADYQTSSEDLPLPGPRKHHRVVRRGGERFEAGGAYLDPQDRQAEAEEKEDDDRRILGELPPHWGLFPAEKG